MRQVLVFLFVAGLASEVAAGPAGALEALLSKLAKASEVAKEAPEAGRAAKAGVATKRLESLPGENTAARAIPAAVEPRANTAVEPIAKIREDADRYKALRAAAMKGNADAMLKLSDMTLSGKVTDPGEPYHAYWLFNATRNGARATPKLQSECARSAELRRNDRWFDSACRTIDGNAYYVEVGIPGTTKPSRILPVSQAR